MFLRPNKRKKNGKTHRYFSVVENRRTAGGGTTQRQVLYLGEINDSQQEAWRRTLSVFDEDRRQYCELSLFPDDRPLPPGALDAISVKLDQMRLRRPRSFGDCWLGCWLWETLHLSSFWNIQLADDRGDVPWAKVLQLLVVNRLIDPGSELRIHRQWFLRSAMDDLLEVDFAAAGKDRLYRCLDRILAHKDALCRHLAERWKTLFDTSFDVLLYDLTSTYFEGLCAQIPKAKHGYSRDGRSDCDSTELAEVRQVVIALVVTPDGLPLAYEVLAGNTTDKTTLRQFLAKIEQMYGRPRRTWIMDRGIPTEATLKVKLAKHEGEFYVLAHSDQRQLKEKAMRRRRFKAYARGLHALRRRCREDHASRIKRDTLLGRLAVLKKEAGRMAAAVTIRVPDEGQRPTPQNFRYELKAEAYREAMERDGSYILRSNAITSDATTMWSMYMQLVRIESAFKSLKSDLAIRPIWHQVQPRVEAHIFVAFMGYCLMAALRKQVEHAAPGLSPRAVLEQLASIQMVDVCLPTSDGRWLIMPRHTEPEAEQSMLLEQLGLELPSQPPPRIRSGSLLLPESAAEQVPTSS